MCPKKLRKIPVLSAFTVNQNQHLLVFANKFSWFNLPKHSQTKPTLTRSNLDQAVTKDEHGSSRKLHILLVFAWNLKQITIKSYLKHIRAGNNEILLDFIKMLLIHPQRMIMICEYGLHRNCYQN